MSAIFMSVLCALLTPQTGHFPPRNIRKATTSHPQPQPRYTTMTYPLKTNKNHLRANERQRLAYADFLELTGGETVGSLDKNWVAFSKRLNAIGPPTKVPNLWFAYFRSQRNIIKRKDPLRRTPAEQRLMALLFNSSKSAGVAVASQPNTQTQTVHDTQMMALIDALQANPTIDMLNDESCPLDVKAWSGLASQLNAMPDGCSGTLEQWWQFWQIWRSFVLSKMMSASTNHGFGELNLRVCAFLKAQYGSQMPYHFLAAYRRVDVMPSTLPVVQWASSSSSTSLDCPSSLANHSSSDAVPIRNVIYTQNMALIKALIANPSMAFDRNEDSEDWMELGLVLNEIPDGCIGSAAQWQQHWRLTHTFVRSKMAFPNFRFSENERLVRDFLLSVDDTKSKEEDSPPSVPLPPPLSTPQTTVYTEKLSAVISKCRFAEPEMDAGDLTLDAGPTTPSTPNTSTTTPQTPNTSSNTGSPTPPPTPQPLPSHSPAKTPLQPSPPPAATTVDRRPEPNEISQAINEHCTKLFEYLDGQIGSANRLARAQERCALALEQAVQVKRRKVEALEQSQQAHLRTAAAMEQGVQAQQRTADALQLIAKKILDEKMLKDEAVGGLLQLARK